MQQQENNPKQPNVNFTGFVKTAQEKATSPKTEGNIPSTKANNVKSQKTAEKTAQQTREHANAAETWVALAVAQMRWERARKLIAPELEAHIEDATEQYQKAGKTEEEAQHLALQEMGSALETGTMLDSVHRPRPNWVLLTSVIFLIGLGSFLAFLAKLSSWGLPLASALGVAMFAVGTGVLLVTYFADYTLFCRHAIGFFVMNLLLFYGFVFLLPWVIWLAYWFSTRQIIAGEKLAFVSAVVPLLVLAQTSMYYYIRVFSHNELYKKRWLLSFFLITIVLPQMGNKNGENGLFIGAMYFVPVLVYLAFVGQDMAKGKVNLPKPKAWFWWGFLVVAHVAGLVWGTSNTVSAFNRIASIETKAKAGEKLLATAGLSPLLTQIIMGLLVAGFVWALWKALGQTSVYGKMLGVICAVCLLTRVALFCVDSLFFAGVLGCQLPFIGTGMVQLILDCYLMGLLLSVLRMEGTARDVTPIPEKYL